MNTKLLKSLIFYMLSALGISLTIKAQIGVSSFNSMNVAISEISQIKVGTITILVNSGFLILYMLMTQFQFKRKYVLQILFTVLFGYFINFFTYKIFGGAWLLNYPERVLMMAVGTVIGGTSVGMIVSYNVITFPIESVCKVLSERGPISFTRYRYSVDIIAIIISVTLSLVFDRPLFVREGTLISFLLLSYSMGAIQKKFVQ